MLCVGTEDGFLLRKIPRELSFGELRARHPPCYAVNPVGGSGEGGMDAVEALAIDGGAVVETAFAGVATDDVNYGAVFYTVPCERSYPQIGRISKLAEYLLNPDFALAVVVIAHVVGAETHDDEGGTDTVDMVGKVARCSPRLRCGTIPDDAMEFETVLCGIVG